VSLCICLCAFGTHVTLVRYTRRSVPQVCVRLLHRPARFTLKLYFILSFAVLSWPGDIYYNIESNKKIWRLLGIYLCYCTLSSSTSCFAYPFSVNIANVLSLSRLNWNTTWHDLSGISILLLPCVSTRVLDPLKSLLDLCAYPSASSVSSAWYTVSKLAIPCLSVFLNFIGSHYDRAKAQSTLLIVISVL